MSGERFELFFSADEVLAALEQLGRSTTAAEARVFVAAETFARLIDYPPFPESIEDDEPTVWMVEHYLNPDAARQASRPHVVISRYQSERDGQ